LRFRQTLVLAGLIAGFGCGGGNDVTAPSSGVTQLQVTDITVGTGATATAGSRANVDYAVWLYDAAAAENKGTLVDSGSFAFVLGTGSVIAGFDQGVTGMRVGGRRRLVIPPNLAYGSQGSGPIPPNATLVFEVQLNSIG